MVPFRTRRVPIAHHPDLVRGMLIAGLYLIPLFAHSEGVDIPQ